MNNIKTRIEKESNYKSIWCNGKTLRFAIDPNKPISKLKYPEFYDIKITNKCFGQCSWCYMNSKPDDLEYENIIQKTRNFFKVMDKNQLPFQVAIGGGEPTESQSLMDLIKVLKEEFDITPNYTTNGMWIYNRTKWDILPVTKKYCGGVAVSCHPHLEKYWKEAAKAYINWKIKLNFHIIISDKESIDSFLNIFEEWKNKIDYFVLLPYGAQGRAKPKSIDWDYFVSVFPKDKEYNKKIAFGANFYPYLLRKDLDINVSLYEPELMSKFLDLKDMSLYPSSFNLSKTN